MKKNLYIVLISVMVILGVWCFVISREEISLYSGDDFCFHDLEIGCSEEYFLQMEKDAELFETCQGVHGEEHVYVKKFKSGGMHREVSAYYYFEDSEFRRGVYEIVFAQEEKEQFFDDACDFLLKELTAADESVRFDLNFSILDRRLLYALGEESLQAHKVVEFEGKNNWCRMRYYILPDMEQKQHALTIEIGKCPKRVVGRGYGWPEEIETSRNPILYDDTDLLHEPHMNIVRLTQNELWAMNLESGELVHYEFAEDYIISAVLDPMEQAEISLEQLEEGIWSQYREWRIVLNENGELFHLAECMLP